MDAQSAPPGLPGVGRCTLPFLADKSVKKYNCLSPGRHIDNRIKAAGRGTWARIPFVYFYNNRLDHRKQKTGKPDF